VSGATVRAVFLDRDGTVIEDVGYPRDPEQVRFLPGALAGLAALRAAGWLLVVISNQSGIGRGLITPEEAEAVHARFECELGDAGISLAGARYCPHAPAEHCSCRKPSPEMILDAASSLGIDLAASYMVGDKESDVEAGRRAGTRTIRFTGEWGAVTRIILTGG
jgi:histidinol-phosphate phosphatase family protein